MNHQIERLQVLLEKGANYIKETAEEQLSSKPSADKWSEKEILGHLIDSAINNLQRFTEIQFEEKPYTIRKYNQDELVKANQYNTADKHEILACWLALNNRIAQVMNAQNEETLAYTLEVSPGEELDLRFLMTDYVDHLEHHLKQIIN